MADKHEISLREFAEKNLVIKDEHGHKIGLTNAQLDMLDAIDEAYKRGCELKRIWVRGRYVWGLSEPKTEPR